MKHHYERTIEDWMLSAIKDGGIQRFDDLHIDEISKTWDSPRLWIVGGLVAFQLALRLRDSNKLPFTLALAFALEANNRPRGVDFETRDELIARLDEFTPPSLYLFLPGSEPWVAFEREIRVGNASTCQFITGSSVNLFPEVAPPRQLYYMELRRGGADGVFSATLMISG